ncbi:hypothetical protein ACO1O0_004981 [Amphichorda felina]
MRISRANSIFWLVWACALVWCYVHAYDDPSSIFYSPRRAFRRVYSAIRQAEAASFFDRLATKATPHDTISTSEHDNELICIGIPSVNRSQTTPLLHSLGTLSDSLTAEERDSIYIVVLLADKNPRNHFAYGAPWLTQLADDVLVYDSHDDTKDAPNRPEPDDAYRVIPYDLHRGHRGWTRTEMTHLDHSVLIETCRQRGAPYFALIQDDVVASRDWYRRLRAGIFDVDQRAQQTGQDWFYIRLFYSEMLMGWNGEEFPGYFRKIAVVYGVLIAVFFVAWRLRRRPRWHKKLSIGPPTAQNFGYTAALVLGLWTPAVIALIFLTGRVTLHRMTTAPCVREMPQYGCCAQGLVFPNRHLEGLQNLLREPPYRYPADMVIDGYGDERGLTKWALDPSVLQHVGINDSSDRGKRVEVWNFSFERLH